MIVKPVSRTFDSIIDLGYENLLASGCSFTRNKGLAHIESWPYYLRDLANFKQVYDCSCAGAGNKHIHDSVIYALEEDETITPENTFVIVMWSAYDRDDFIVSQEHILEEANCSYLYKDTVGVAITGGLAGRSNSILSLDNIKKLKTHESRAVENYICISGLHHYLNSRGFSFVFTEFSTPGTKRDLNFDIANYLDPVLVNKFKNLVRGVSPNLGDYGQQFDIAVDPQKKRYHPTVDAQLNWTRDILIPYLRNKNDCKN